MPEQPVVEPRLLKGFRDYLPAQMNARLKLISTIRRVYELYGFQPLDTPAQEYKVTLVGYGEENTKQIFTFPNPEEEEVALRFDLTVPLARVVAQYLDLGQLIARHEVRLADRFTRQAGAASETKSGQKAGDQARSQQLWEQERQRQAYLQTQKKRQKQQERYLFIGVATTAVILLAIVILIALAR